MENHINPCNDGIQKFCSGAEIGGYEHGRFALSQDIRVKIIDILFKPVFILLRLLKPLLSDMFLRAYLLMIVSKSASDKPMRSAVSSPTRGTTFCAKSGVFLRAS